MYIHLIFSTNLSDVPEKEFFWFFSCRVQHLKLRSKITECPAEHSMYTCTDKLNRNGIVIYHLVQVEDSKKNNPSNLSLPLKTTQPLPRSHINPQNTPWYLFHTKRFVFFCTPLDLNTWSLTLYSYSEPSSPLDHASNCCKFLQICSNIKALTVPISSFPLKLYNLNRF